MFKNRQRIPNLMHNRKWQILIDINQMQNFGALYENDGKLLLRRKNNIVNYMIKFVTYNIYFIKLNRL